MRNDCVLSTLTNDQKDQLYDWLCESGYSATIKRVALPSPDGLGIRLHRTTLVRFYTEYSRDLHRQTIIDVHPTKSDAEDRVLLSASKSALAHSTYALAHTSGEPQLFNQLSRALYRQEMLSLKKGFLAIAEQHAALARDRLDLEHRRLKLDEIKFRFEASREVATHAVAIKKTLSDKKTTPEQKVWQVSDIVFGPRPDTANYHACSPNPSCSPPPATQ